MTLKTNYYQAIMICSMAVETINKNRANHSRWKGQGLKGNAVANCRFEVKCAIKLIRDLRAIHDDAKLGGLS